MNNAALSLTGLDNANEAKDGGIESLIESLRGLIETTQATLEGLDGKAKNDVAGALVNMMNAVAKQVESK